jgi:hypothetical protein
MAYMNRTSREILGNLNGFAYAVIVTVAFCLLIHARTRIEDSGSSPIKSGRPVTQIFLYAWAVCRTRSVIYMLCGVKSAAVFVYWPKKATCREIISLCDFSTKFMLGFGNKGLKFLQNYCLYTGQIALLIIRMSTGQIALFSVHNSDVNRTDCIV